MCNACDVCMYMHTTHACHIDIHYIPWCTCTRLSSLHLYPLRAPGLWLVTALLWIVMRWTPLQTGTSLSVPSHQTRRYSTTYSKSYNCTSIPAQNQCLHEYGSTRTRSLLHHGGNRDQYSIIPTLCSFVQLCVEQKARWAGQSYDVMLTYRTLLWTEFALHGNQIDVPSQ